MIDYEAAAKALWSDKGWTLCKNKKRVEALARQVVDAALAGTELYELDRRKFDAATYPAFQELEWREVLVRVGEGTE